MQTGIHAVNSVRTKVRAKQLVMEMFGVKREHVEKFLRESNGHIVKVEKSRNAPGWVDFWYYVAKIK